MSNRTFKAGDTVHHKPTGETWSLVRDQQGENVFPGGWPQTMAKASDCELLESGEMKRLLDSLTYTPGPVLP